MASTSPITQSSPGLIRTFLLDHERLIIVTIVAVGLWFGYGKYADIRLQHDNAVLAQAKITSDAQAKANAALAQQVADDKASLQALTDKVTAQNQQLVNANTALATALAARQKTDATLPPTELAARWSQLVPQATPTATPSGLLVPSAGAVATVQALEQIDPLKAQVANDQGIIANDNSLISQQGKSILDLTNQVAGATKLDTDHQAQCVDQINVVKAQAAKSKRRWFIIGYVAGFLSRQFLTK
jgi:hypothetical protein